MSATNPIVSCKQISLERLIKAPIALVFEAWTRPEHIQHWWGPSGFTNTISQMDVHPQGEWIFVMHGPDGKDYPNRMKFTELEPNKKIVMEHTVPPYFRMTVNFEAAENNTLLKVTNEFESAEVLEQIIKAVNADEGLKQNIDKLEDYLQQQEEAEGLLITRNLDAPKELVWKAFTEPERFAQWWGPKGFQVKIAGMEFKAGGFVHYSMQAGPAEMWGKFLYLEVAAPDRLVFVSCFSDKDGNITPNPYASVWPLQVKNTLTLAEENGKTLLTLKGHPINASAEERNVFKAAAQMMQQGFAGTFEQLDHYLARETAKALLPIVVERTLNAPANKVWKALTDKQAIKQWSFDIAEFEPVPGFEFTFKGGKPDGIVYIHLCKIMEVIPEQKLSYTWRFEGYEGDSLLTFELTAMGDKTHLRLTHSDIDTFPTYMPDFAVPNFIEGWNYIVNTSLKNFVEGNQ